MNFRQLEAFRATMRSGSITRAAASLNLSQPTVSRLIKDLEAQIGFALFIKLGRGIRPTTEGQKFYEGVEATFMGLDRLDDLAKTLESSSGGTLSLGVIPSLATIEIPSAINSLYQTRPDVKLQIYLRNTPAIIEAIQLQQLDLGVISRQPPYNGVEILYQTTLPYVCLVPEEHALAGSQTEVNLNDLAQTETFITFGGIFPEQIAGLDTATITHLKQRSRLSAANMPMAAALAKETGALAIVDVLSAGVAVGTGGVTSLPLVQNLEYHLAVVAQNAGTLSRHGQELAGIIAKRLDRIRC
ncbi:LysR family transcriptional regulator [Paracoccaceae bacterium]|nr:LysR family transcriptional regulator [Paracoccaceae bacterium]